MTHRIRIPLYGVCSKIPLPAWSSTVYMRFRVDIRNAAPLPRSYKQKVYRETGSCVSSSHSLISGNVDLF